MKNLFIYIGLRNLRFQPARTCLTSLGVALGVALFVAIQIINRSTIASFRESIESTAGKAQLVVTGGETGLPESKLKLVESVGGVKHAVPMVQTRAFLTGGTTTESLTILGVDLLKEQSVRTYKTSNQEVIDDPLIFLNQPDSVILTHSFAEAHHLHIDSTIEIATVSGKKRLTVRGLLTPEGPAKAFGGAVAIMDIDGAQQTFGKKEKLDRIDLVLDPKFSEESVKKALESKLGPGYSVENPESQVNGMSHLVQSYQTMLSFFSTLALLAGVFLVTNSVSISVAERRREIGVLRALGSSRGAILILFLLEALTMGICGSVLGLYLGRLLSIELLHLVSESMSMQYLITIETHRLVFDSVEMVKGLTMGSLAALVAAFIPAYRATTVEPLDALKKSDMGTGTTLERKVRPSVWIGAGIFIYLALSSRFLWGTHSHFIAIFNEGIAVIGPALLGPGLVAFFIFLFKLVFAPIRGPMGRLAENNLLQNPRRTGSNIITLMVGLVLVMIVASINVSFKASIISWFDRVLKADFLVSSYGRVVAYQVQPLSEEIGRELEQVPGILKGPKQGAYATRFIHFYYEGHQLGLKTYDEPDPNENYSLFEVQDRTSAEAGHDLYHSAGLTVLVSENFVLHFKKKTGDAITLLTPSGEVHARIVGVITDFASPEGVVYMSRENFKKYWQDSLVDAFGIRVAPGYKASDVRRAIDQRFGKSKNLMTISNSEMREDIIRSIDEGFRYTKAIEISALLVAMLSLLNTFLISVMERTRELGTLRALGMSRGQMANLLVQESLLQGGFGAIVAVGLGAYIAKLWIAGSLSYILGWIIHFSFPWASVLTTILTGVGVTPHSLRLPCLEGRSSRDQRGFGL